jgi:N-acetylglutamate synthase-like GNAT family acetyltransferase
VENSRLLRPARIGVNSDIWKTTTAPVHGRKTMNPIQLRIVDPADAQAVATILHDALELPDRLWQLINEAAYTTYAGVHSDEIVAGAVMRWGAESEIAVLAVADNKRGRGIGQSVVAEIVVEAKRRQVGTLLVGTSSISIDNILFYQKCGFRMSHIRRGFFDEVYPELQVEWRGVKLHDMIMFDYDLR